MSAQPRILITGASGFIGSHIVEAAIAAGFEVTAGVRSTSNRKYLVSEKLKFLELDWSSAESLSVSLKKTGHSFDIVVHNAGITSGNRKTYYRVNARQTGFLIHALNTPGLQPGRFILISSLAVHGPGDPDTFRPIRKEDEFHPISDYARSKLMGEKALQDLATFPFQVIRPAAVYGPRDKDFFTLFKMVKRGYSPGIGSYRQMLSMIHAKDLASGIVGIGSRPLKSEAYLVSDTFQYDKKDLTRILQSVFGTRARTINIPRTVVLPVAWLIEGLYSVTGATPFLHPKKILEISSPNWLCDCGDFWTDAGILPQFDLNKGLQQTSDWYVEQKWL